MIYPVPDIFKVPDVFYYPEDNCPDFEYWFMQNAPDHSMEFDRIYLPILFTSYFKRNQYGKDQLAIDFLQRFVDTLPTDKKYFTIVQYDDGTLVDWKGKDVAVFSMSGKPVNCIPIPLVCQPHKFKFPSIKYRDILCSFVGRVTDPMRKKIIEWGEERKGSVYITSKPHGLQHYCEIMYRSKFVLCPRGYGASSFRICEAIQYGAEPVVFINHDDNTFESKFFPGYIIRGEVNNSILDALDKNMMSLVNVPSFFDVPYSTDKLFYTFEGVKKIILQQLWSLQ